MARKSAASERKQSPNIAAAISAANELTTRTSFDVEAVGYIEMGLREMFTTYAETANPKLQKAGLRITRLDVDLEYGVNHQAADTMVERNEGVNVPARDLANGVIHLGINGVEPQTINLSLFQTPAESSDGANLIIMVGNRNGDATDPHLFMLQVDEKDPKSFLPIHDAKGERISLISRTENPISILDFIGQKIQDMAINKRTHASIAQHKPAA